MPATSLSEKMRKLDVEQKKGVVCKLHVATKFAPPPRQFINWGLLVKMKGILCGNPAAREGKFKTKLLAARQFISPPQGALIVCRKREASGQKNYYTSSIYIETSPTPYRKLRPLRARSVLGSVRESVPRKSGCPKRVSKRCPESVSGVSGHPF